jgi:hypothetical protein
MLMWLMEWKGTVVILLTSLVVIVIYSRYRLVITVKLYCDKANYTTDRIVLEIIHYFACSSINMKCTKNMLNECYRY